MLSLYNRRPVAGIIKELMKRFGRPRGELWVMALVVLVLAAAYCAWAVRRPLPAITASQPVVKARTPLPDGKAAVWPAQGQAALGIVGDSTVSTHGHQTPAPTASTAKLITALVVLQARPLQLGQSGPMITLSANDVAIYNGYVAQDGSLVKVQAGEQISEYQMLEAMLLPSANNMADSLAIWAFGSLENYSKAANQYLEDKGLTGTHVGSDASGFDPGTVSTAGDLVRIGKLVMQAPLLAQIVGQPAASGIPMAGNVKNVNFLLGTAGIIGIKTGNTDQAGGVYVSASQVKVNGRPVTIVTALMGSPTLFQALKDSIPLIQSAQANFKTAVIIRPGTVAGSYRLPWGGSVSAVADRNLALSGWAGSDIPFTVSLRSIPADARAGRTVGSLTVKESAVNGRVSIPIILKTAPPEPSLSWRLTHPF
jgi:serine-type D-Ala-D-Ala carboxypeptidase (penicillin-binding protein 5/6)